MCRSCRTFLGRGLGCGLLQARPQTLKIVACQKGKYVCEDVGHARGHVVRVLMCCGVEVELVFSVSLQVYLSTCFNGTFARYNETGSLVQVPSSPLDAYDDVHRVSEPSCVNWLTAQWGTICICRNTSLSRTTIGSRSTKCRFWMSISFASSSPTVLTTQPMQGRTMSPATRELRRSLPVTYTFTHATAAGKRGCSLRTSG